MRLLIVTQVVDTEDPVLGFFVRWIEELAKRIDHIEVVCLKLGRSDLPKNVSVHSLGKERGTVNRVMYAWRFLSLAWKLRSEYDAVFIHMNQEYVLIAGLLWKLLGKRVYVWRNHAKGSWKTDLSVWFSRQVFYTSPGSYVASFNNAKQMPVGIDTEYLSPAQEPREGVLVLGRIDPVKRVGEMIDAVRIAAKQIDITLTVVGDATYRGGHYENKMLQGIAAIPGAQKISSVPYDVARSFFRKAEVFLNFTPEGSFDKTIFDAMACGTLPLVTNTGLRGILPEECSTSIEDAPQSLVRLLQLPEDEKTRLRVFCREVVVKYHSLHLLGDRLMLAFIPRRAILFQNGSIGDFLMFVHLSELLMKSGLFSGITIVVPRNVEFLRGLIKEYPYISILEASSRQLGTIFNLYGGTKTVLVHPTIGRIPLKVKLLVWMISRGSESESIGFQDSGALCDLYDKKLVYDTEKPYVDTVNDLARAVGVRVTEHPPRLKSQDSSEALAKYGLEGKKYIVFHPGASNPRRMFSTDAAVKVIRFIIENFPDMKVVLSGGSEERRFISGITQEVGGEKITIIVNAEAEDLATVLKHAELFIGTDTGTTHLACFLGTHVLEVAHKATANWLAFYTPKATVLYRITDDATTHTEQAYLQERAKGVLRPFGTVPVEDVCNALLKFREAVGS